MTPSLFIFLGRSGCGKGTQAGFLSDYLKKKTSENGVFYVSTGDQFRKLIESGSYTASEVKPIVAKGDFVPSFLASMMWANVIAENYKENDHMIVDGSPRTLAEKAIFETIYSFYGEGKVFDFENVYVVFINVSIEWAMDKLLKRADTEGRVDDKKDAIEKRMYWFDKYVAPVIESFKNDSKVRFCEINGEQSREEVHQEIISKIN